VTFKLSEKKKFIYYIDRYTKKIKGMKNIKTKSEKVFETFLIGNNLEFKEIAEDDSPRPDYLVKIGVFKMMFEIKELAEDKNFKTKQFSVSSRTVGEHIRKKIQEARKQIQFAAKQGLPSILLIYNNLDPLHLFGTENMDFISAMYGEYTVVFDKSNGKISDSFHGRNQSFAAAKNTSFSAIGRLSPYLGKMKVTLFENVFSKIKIHYDRLPVCFDVINFKIETV
jgi:hypothetical protein